MDVDFRPAGWCGMADVREDSGVVGDVDVNYLAGLAADQQAALQRVNRPGLTALRGYLASKDAGEHLYGLCGAWWAQWLGALALAAGDTAHGTVDQAEGIDRGWAAQADALHAQLVPPGLDPDPLATVERLVAAQKTAVGHAAGNGEDGSEG